MIGSRLRQYVLAEKLGEGGMGVVWKAYDTTLERDVALKILPADGAASEVHRERFFREARAASALNHPNIITVYEINADGETDFIAMELVEGETLSTRIVRGALALGDTLTIARQIAAAVARAHRAGVVHRDLKPGNVMISYDGLVKVLDFGLAKVGVHKTDEERRDEETRLALTRVGTALGTLGYMSPEQALGDPVDARSDVFSFGVIVYQMLAGTLPFQGNTNTELLRALHFDEPKPLAVVRPDVPAWLDTVVTKALAKEPKARFADMGEVVAALKHPVAATPADPARRLAGAVGDLQRSALEGARSVIGRARGRQNRRPRMALQTAFWIALSLGIAAYYAVPWEDVLRRDAGESVSPATADDSASKLTRDAALLLQRHDRDGNVDKAIELLTRAQAQDATSAPVAAQLADAYRRKHDQAPDSQWLKLARQTAERAVALDTDLAAAHLAQGWVHRADGRLVESEAAFRRAGELDPVNAMPKLGLAMTLAGISSRDDEADAMFRQAIALSSVDWRPHSAFADYLYGRARYAEAADHWAAARRLTPDNAIVLRNLGAVYFRLGRYDEAASTFQRSLEIQPSPATYTNLGTLRFFQGKYAEAVLAFEKAVELGATRHVNWGNLADGYRWAPGRRGEAPAAYRRASDLIGEQIAKRPSDPDLRSRHAVYLVKMGNTPAALEELKQIPNPEELTAQQLYRLVMVYELGGDRMRALSTLERALQAGYPVSELKDEPEFTSLRSDARYQRLIARF